MLDLLEWEVLCRRDILASLHIQNGAEPLTESLSTIPAAPATEEDSNVNIELSR